ncbi:MAG: DUF72 domain-containing protein [Thaumarchaeota archaeon]|nr:DUF72 domain-containing protein [Nitrososphaerota archaeon]
MFYPKGEKAKLSYYARYFKTVEIDSTFYAFPRESMVSGAIRNTPPDFVFSAKLPKVITHEESLDLEKGARRDLTKFMLLMRPLEREGKLGALLIQLPPSFAYEGGLPRLRRFLGILPRDVRFAVEFRNRSWLGKGDVDDLLRSHNVARTLVDEPLLPPETAVTADFSFIRWHGHGKRLWYSYRYGDGELEAWVPRVKEVASKVKRVYGYANNHPFGHAVETAFKEMGMLGIANKEQETALARVTKAIDARARPPDRSESLLGFVNP